MTETNPLLENLPLPAFSRILPEHVEPAIHQILADNRAALERLLQNDAHSFTWNTLVEPLEVMDERLTRAWSPVGHLNAVRNSDALRAAYNACLPLLSEYGAEMGHNRALFDAYQAVASRADDLGLDSAQRKILEDALRDFHLAGVDLPEDQKSRFKDVVRELSELTAKFEDNLMDATHGWHRRVHEEGQMAGLPESARLAARERAEHDGVDGWVFTLDFPSYVAVMTYADDRALRREMYEAYVTRASEVGPCAGRWDNGALMDQILFLRHEQARLLGFADFAQLSLATKMAESPSEVAGFLRALAARARGAAERDRAELEAFALSDCGLETLESWDVSYVSEKLRLARFAFSEEDLRPYFPAERVVSGLFALAQELFAIRIAPADGEVDLWHGDVRFYEIRDGAGTLRGQFYLDLYARSKKRGGAWMDDCATRWRHVDGALQTPVAFLVCNFPSPTREMPALLRHDDVLTLFHEFGHGLHHLLTRVDYRAASGVHGVEWDAVELPSQFLENFAWEREVLVDRLSGHWLTGEKLPEALYRKMLKAKNFQSGLQMLRQIEFSLFDLRIHAEVNPERGGRVYPILDEVRGEVAVLRPPVFNRFPNSFAHIFAGGYAAGYYSYKWAEVLSADAYALFEEAGVFNPQTGRRFCAEILEAGGARPAMDSFRAFRGREPEIDALLRHSGIG